MKREKGHTLSSFAGIVSEYISESFGVVVGAVGSSYIGIVPTNPRNLFIVLAGVLCFLSYSMASPVATIKSKVKGSAKTTSIPTTAHVGLKSKYVARRLPLTTTNPNQILFKQIFDFFI